MKRSLAVAGALVASLAIGGVVLAATGNLAIGAPWGPADQDPSNGHRVELTYTIKATGKIPASTVQAVQDAIDAWNLAIDGRESGWGLDLVPLGVGGASATGNPIRACHSRGNDPKGCGPPPPSNGDDRPDIEIQIKGGGGVIAGSAQSTFENGFRVRVKIQIAGKSFGLPNLDAQVMEVAEHELGHALALGHHSNEDDLMGRTVGSVGGISACDLDGFEESHHWLTTDGTTTPHSHGPGTVNCL